VRTPDEVVDLFDAVTVDDVRRVAQQLFDARRLTLALVGPFKGDRRFLPLMKL
jgi:predicted Zn-dependent peptidase